jgi:hypothetical protein
VIPVPMKYNVVPVFADEQERWHTLHVIVGPSVRLVVLVVIKDDAGEDLVGKLHKMRESF